MRLATTALAAALLFVPTLPALADAVTYKGTIGNIPVVVELSADPTVPGTAPFGRYFYPDKGVDIPLVFMAAEPGLVVLLEEGPCTEATCPAGEDGKAIGPPFGALWQLELGTGDSATLTGKWQADGPLLDVALERIGTREFEDPGQGPEGLALAAQDAVWVGGTIDEATLPYDAYKMMIVTYEVAKVVTDADGSSYQYVVDPRTRFAVPRIVDPGDGSDPAIANAFLQQRHWGMNAAALGCAAMQYPSMGWNSFIASAAGTLGYWDEETITVQYLSPTILSWTESGSLYCGGAHPHNHRNFENLDIRTGARLEMSRIFTDRDAVIEFVLANRTPGDPAFEAECGTEELIRNYLAISFKEGERVLFGLNELPHAIQACADDVWETPLADLPRELLAPTASDYFPSLAQGSN